MTKLSLEHIPASNSLSPAFGSKGSGRKGAESPQPQSLPQASKIIAREYSEQFKALSSSGSFGFFDFFN